MCNEAFGADIEHNVGAWLAITVSLLGAQLSAEPANPKLPKGADIIERVQIPGEFSSNRELILWMISPQNHERPDPNDPYTCPEETLGSYYSGPTRISLVNTDTGTVVNTIALRSPDGDADSFDVPYRIVPDYYYLVPGQKEGSEGKPALLALRDLNGDGLPLETAFYEAEACMGLPTTMIGYSPRQDKVVQYEVQLTSPGSNPETETWVDYLFAEKPVSPGHWQFQIDYSGRGGDLEEYDVRYDPSTEKFSGSHITGPGAFPLQ